MDRSIPTSTLGAATWNGYHRENRSLSSQATFQQPRTRYADSPAMSSLVLRVPSGHCNCKTPSRADHRDGAARDQRCWEGARKMESSRFVPYINLQTIPYTYASLCVATATYRLHPLILLNPSKPVPPHLAQKFASCFSPGVVRVSPDGQVRYTPTPLCTKENWLD